MFILEGHVASLADDTLYIYGADALYEHIDTVVARNGAFRYKASVDTVTPMWILFPNMHREMLFADKGLTATMQGDTAARGYIHIFGGKQNALLSQFHQLTNTIEDNNRVTQLAD